jgi:hypothetical protein
MSIRSVAGDERRLLGTVVATLHDDNLVPARVGACEANRRHRGLGAAVDKAEHFDTRDVSRDEFGKFDFDLGWCAIHRSLAGSLLDGRPD